MAHDYKPSVSYSILLKLMKTLTVRTVWVGMGSITWHLLKGLLKIISIMNDFLFKRWLQPEPV